MRPPRRLVQARPGRGLGRKNKAVCLPDARACDALRSGAKAAERERIALGDGSVHALEVGGRGACRDHGAEALDIRVEGLGGRLLKGLIGLVASSFLAGEFKELVDRIAWQLQFIAP